jgi:formylglycine-generating enzyme required for sulfatase activity
MTDPQPRYAMLDDPALSHQRRLEIGDRLAHEGDTRPGVGLRPDGLPDLSWCVVPAAQVVVRWGVNGLMPTESRTFEVGALRISRYPVTHAQFQVFRQAPDGFADSRWWTGLAVRPSEAGTQRYPLANRPAEHVSWYEAVAFCRWLSLRLGAEIRLPYEQEWHLAASGGDADRVYPWGATWDKLRANVEDAALRQTTAVGVYPAGAAPCGALDMIGNVWEWCLNADIDPTYAILSGNFHRVLRGGAWATGRPKANTWYRGGDIPTRRRSNIGFRVVMPG